jgi:DNA-binding transcriptional MerR regulator
VEKIGPCPYPHLDIFLDLDVTSWFIVLLEVLMGYSIKQLAELAGISPRALRWYEARGLLEPRRLANGYRVYEAAEVDRLQQILFFRELGFELEEIGTLMRADDYDVAQALRAQLEALAARRKRLDALMATMEKTIRSYEGEMEMSDSEKFEAFKQGILAENEQRYGAEARERWGEAEVEASNQQFASLTPEQYAEVEALTERVRELLVRAVASRDVDGPLARELVEAHREWLSCYWPEYTPEKHKGVAQMYVDDPRFSAYYEEMVAGGAVFLRDAVWEWA